MLGAVDRGYRVLVVVDALCSASDESHDAMVLLYGNRYGCQVEMALTEEVLAHWRRAPTPTGSAEESGGRTHQGPARGPSRI